MEIPQAAVQQSGLPTVNQTVQECREKILAGKSVDGTALTNLCVTPCPMMNAILNHKMRPVEQADATRSSLVNAMHILAGVRMDVAQGWCELINDATLQDLSRAHDFFPAGPGALVRSESSNRQSPQSAYFDQLCKVAAYLQNIPVEQLRLLTKEHLLTASQLRIDQDGTGSFVDNTARRAEMELLYGLFENHSSCPSGYVLLSQIKDFLMDNKIPDDFEYDRQGKTVPAVSGAVFSGLFSAFWSHSRRAAVSNLEVS